MTEASVLPSTPRLAKYELLEEIGHGGMATVYRARDKRLGRDVAIKIIHKHLRENKEVGTRFLAEARAAAKLRHPSIVEVHDVSGEEDAERYLVVELCRGTTLRKILENHREMPAEIGAAITLVLCDALEHAHASGIIHRDVKPENVLVELPADRECLARSSTPVREDEPSEPESSRRPIAARVVETNDEKQGSRRVSKPSDLGVLIKLTDFGIAKILDAQGVTSTGQVLGSPAHMAPEQIEAGEVDGRTDVFALGVLMYECLVGHLPFEGKNPAQVLRRVLEGEYPPVDRERNTVGGRWARIVDGALARSLEQRTASPDKLAKQIRSELEALGITDSRAEIEAYFADPEGYSRALTEKLVPKILARGEAARKAGDVVGAADDFNRALALAPHDQTIFKRVRGLRSSEARRRIAIRVAAVVGAATVLGGVAYGVARARKPGAAEVVVGAEPTEITQTDGSILPRTEAPTEHASNDVPHSVASAVLDPLERSRNIRARIAAIPSVAVPVVDRPVPSFRKVMFVINPQGAQLTLDGRDETWFSRVFTLRTGSHSVSVRVAGSKCCEPHSGSVTVEAAPDGDAEQVQRIPIRLKPLPATVALVGAPQGGHLACTDIALSVQAGASKTVQFGDVTWTGRCQFMPPASGEPIRKTIQLRAGEHNDVPWPQK